MLLQQLHQLDPKCDGARYGTTRDGKPTLLDVTRVDLEHAQVNLTGMAEFIPWVELESGWIMGISGDESSHQDM